MKRLLLLVLIMNGVLMQAQDNSALIKHYETYTKQMKTQGDVQGIISGLTHLNILKPSGSHFDMQDDP